MKVLDLFSGIGGFSLGLERAGFKTVSFCEIDQHCHKVLKKNWPQIPIIDDVSKLDGYTLKQILGSIDVICGGFPCTDISVAGKQKGLIDESGNITRSGLWFEYKRIIEEIKPKYVIIENVANLRSKGLASVLKDLWSLGYDSEWHIISARSVGACHLRERVWIIAYPSGKRWEQGAGENLQPKIEKKYREKSPHSCKKKITRRNLEDAEFTDSISSRTRLEKLRSDSQGWNRGVEPGRKMVQQKNRAIGSKGSRASIEEVVATNPNCERLTGASDELQKSSRKREGKNQNEGDCLPRAIASYALITNTDNLRCWKPFTTESEKFEWWAKATSRFSDWWEIESPICRMDDGLSNELDTPERVRKERIKQLGNTIVPQIAEFIGEQILAYEKKQGEF